MYYVKAKGDLNRSLSARRAWIEIVGAPVYCKIVSSLSARRAWIEIVKFRGGTGILQSLSARRAWIEISKRVPMVTYA